MGFELARTSDTTLEVGGNIEDMAPVVWRALNAAGLKDVTIHPEWRQVGANTPTRWDGNGSIVRVYIEPASLVINRKIRVEVKPVLPGTIDFGASKRYARDLTDKIASQFKYETAPGGPVQDSPTPAVGVGGAPPIADPFANPGASGAGLQGGPVYGDLPLPRMGRLVLTYGILSVFCCQILTIPATLVYGIRALNTYGKEDPGDRTLVYIGMVLAVISAVLLVGRLLLRAAANMN